jgi:hypothetical protein
MIMEQPDLSFIIGFEKATVSCVDSCSVDKLEGLQNLTTKHRKRLSLAEKKVVVDNFYLFYRTQRLFDELPADIYIETFTVNYNNQCSTTTCEGQKLTAVVFKQGIRAEQRGEYLDWWNKMNMLSKKVCYAHKILERIDYLLKKSHKRCWEFNQIAKSMIAANEYGVVARKNIPSGTFLGFYSGACITPEQAEINNRKLFHNYDYLFGINKTCFIDATDLISCYGRYYKRTNNKAKQNVCVKRLLFSDTQKTICFITTKDVKIGQEFLIPFGCECWNHQSGINATPDNPAEAFYRVSQQLKAKIPQNYQHEEDTMFTCPQELRRMSLTFGDNHASPGPAIVMCYDSD